MWGHGILSPEHVVIIAAFREDPEFIDVRNALEVLRRWRLWP
jgi:hypothetical protein